MVDQGKESILQFAPFQSAVDEGYWLRLSSLKLKKLGIDESPIPITEDGVFRRFSFFCYRASRGFADLELSLAGEASISNSQGRCSRIRLAIEAADLNLKLMRWHQLPSLNLNILSSTKCLLLGAGTLGCQVARMLMVWGIRKITLLDSGKVSMSNPLRQSLYNLDDCQNGGEFKAAAAVKSLTRIFPAVVVSEYQRRGLDFILEAINHPTYLEDLTGLTELMNSAGSFDLDWDNDDDDECVEI